MAKESIIVFGAHNDDHIIGAGGTLAKYAKEGKRVFVVIFSYGESSHFWLKKKVTVEMRVNESKKADKIIGIRNTSYLGLKEGNFFNDTKEKKIEARITSMILKNNPEKIFMHCIDDPHPDHRAVYKIILKILDKIDYKGEVYSYEIWNPVNLKKRNSPKLFVDISKTFDKKIESIKAHKSQKMSIFSLLWNVYRKDFFNGMSNNCRFAEVFYRSKR